MEKYYDIIEEIYLLEIMNELAQDIINQVNILEFRERDMFCENIAKIEIAMQKLKGRLDCENEVEIYKEEIRNNQKDV